MTVAIAFREDTRCILLSNCFSHHLNSGGLRPGVTLLTLAGIQCLGDGNRRVDDKLVEPFGKGC